MPRILFITRSTTFYKRFQPLRCTSARAADFTRCRESCGINPPGTTGCPVFLGGFWIQKGTEIWCGLWLGETHIASNFSKMWRWGPQMWSREPQARLGPCFYTQISLVDMNLDETTKITSNSILDSRKNGIYSTGTLWRFRKNIGFSCFSPTHPSH